MRRRNVSNIIERFRTKQALQEERERKNLPASPDGEFISGVLDKNGTREKGIFENGQVRVSTTFVPKGTDWSAPSSSAWRVTWIPANSDINVPNNSGQTKILMILEFKRHGG